MCADATGGGLSPHLRVPNHSYTSSAKKRGYCALHLPTAVPTSPAVATSASERVPPERVLRIVRAMDAAKAFALTADDVLFL